MSININKYFRDRLSVISTLVLGSTSGYGMAAFIDVPEIRTWLISLAIALSLMASLLVSIIVKKADDGQVTRLVLILKRIIVGFAITAFVFFMIYQTLIVTTPVAQPSGEVSEPINIVKGVYYAKESINVRKLAYVSNGAYPTDEVLMQYWLFDTQHVWPKASRICARAIILVVYTVLIALLGAGVTMAIELGIRSSKTSQRPGTKKKDATATAAADKKTPTPTVKGP